jgi:hypothetical protein
MTGYVNGATSMPLSAMTISSLADLGYAVNLLAADPYTVPSGAVRSLKPGTGEAWERKLPKGVVLP